jgi:hypothetical protein
VSAVGRMSKAFLLLNLNFFMLMPCYCHYRGNGASVLRIVPYAALHFMTYEQYRCWILNNFAPSVGTGPVVDLLAGSAAGGTAVLCTYPLDLVRTKLAYQVLHWHVHSYAFFFHFVWLLRKVLHSRYYFCNNTPGNASCRHHVGLLLF